MTVEAFAFCILSSTISPVSVRSCRGKACKSVDGEQPTVKEVEEQEEDTIEPAVVVDVVGEGVEVTGSNLEEVTAAF